MAGQLPAQWSSLRGQLFIVSSRSATLVRGNPGMWPVLCRAAGTSFGPAMCMQDQSTDFQILAASFLNCKYPCIIFLLVCNPLLLWAKASSLRGHSLSFSPARCQAGRVQSARYYGRRVTRPCLGSPGNACTMNHGWVRTLEEQLLCAVGFKGIPATPQSCGTNWDWHLPQL